MKKKKIPLLCRLGIHKEIDYDCGCDMRGYGRLFFRECVKCGRGYHHTTDIHRPLRCLQNGDKYLYNHVERRINRNLEKG